VFRKAYPLVALGHEDAAERKPVSVVGPCCTPLDVFGHGVNLPPVNVGDLVAVRMSGAYGYSASSLHFLSHPTPAEVMLWQGDVHVLREPGRPDQVLAGQRGLDFASDTRRPSPLAPLQHAGEEDQTEDAGTRKPSRAKFAS
jgi:diaminopimelate decarboxylase